MIALLVSLLLKKMPDMSVDGCGYLQHLLCVACNLPAGRASDTFRPCALSGSINTVVGHFSTPIATWKLRVMLRPLGPVDGIDRHSKATNGESKIVFRASGRNILPAGGGLS